MSGAVPDRLQHAHALNLWWLPTVHCATVMAPPFAADVGSEAAAHIAALAPGDLNRVFFTNGEAGAPMQAFAAECKRAGVWPFVHFNRSHILLPCTAT